MLVIACSNMYACFTFTVALSIHQIVALSIALRISDGGKWYLVWAMVDNHVGAKHARNVYFQCENGFSENDSCN